MANGPADLPFRRIDGQSGGRTADPVSGDGASRVPYAETTSRSSVCTISPCPRPPPRASVSVQAGPVGEPLRAAPSSRFFDARPPAAAALRMLRLHTTSPEPADFGAGPREREAVWVRQTGESFGQRSSKL
ncbi:hypothetical protein GCM10023086_20260 [Streptomyces venetus]|uniref:Uncharacterized protein n=1 Tax=Streptomyces venetus TaxID=1701086 RepID=A0ABP8FH80_9ACTN